ncbi:GNAT family N-acetyltransferase [Methylobacterium sp. ID0610]|uniref:GNAT family N-acetyltransferase n=1 Tax=Methylobacterium carpenticola TaxID=3344827 RepID=UPI0036B42F6D
MSSSSAAAGGRPIPRRPDAGPACTVRVLREAEDLDRIEPAWWDLFGRCPAATPFQSPAWLIPWWRHFRPGRLLTLAVQAGDRLAGLLPAYVEDGPQGRRLLLLGIGPSDHLDLLLDPAGEGAAAALSAGLAAERAAFDVVAFEDLAPGAAAWRLPVPAGAREVVADRAACPVLALPREAGRALPAEVDPGSAKGSASGRGPRLADLCSPAKRRKIALARNRSERRGGFETFSRADPAGASALFEDLVALHAARWESRGAAGVLADGTVRDFHRAAVPRLAAAGLVRFHAVRLAGTAAAVLYALRGRGGVYAYLSGFDPAFGFESPGVTVIAAALDAARAEGAPSFHFLRGREPYKYEWGASDVWNRCRSLQWA